MKTVYRHKQFAGVIILSKLFITLEYCKSLYFGAIDFYDFYEEESIKNKNKSSSQKIQQIILKTQNRDLQKFFFAKFVSHQQNGKNK